MQYQEVINQLQALAKPEAAEGMARFGIKGQTVYGISIPELRNLAKQIGANSELAHQLWSSGIHEARILASLIEVPARVTEAQMGQWAQDFDSWDLCDQCCGNLFDKTPWAYAKAVEWSARPEAEAARVLVELARRDPEIQQHEVGRKPRGCVPRLVRGKGSFEVVHALGAQAPPRNRDSVGIAVDAKHLGAG